MSQSRNNVQRKYKIRSEARRLRRELSGKRELSEKIAASLKELSEYIEAKAVLYYVNVRNEVCTRSLIEEALVSDRLVVVPYCDADELKLFRLEDMTELAPGEFGIEEPLPKLRNIKQKEVDPAEIDLVLVPGVAFDPQGGRIGQGKGYYDRFLKSLQDRPQLIGLAYQCQIYPSIPVEPHDVPIDIVVTEENIYRR